MAKILKFNGETRLDIDPDDILDAAKGNLKSLLLIGYDNDGCLYVASSSGDKAQSLWLMECCRKLMMEAVDID